MYSFKTMYEKCKIWVDFSDFDQMQFLNSITKSVAFEFWHFSPIFKKVNLARFARYVECDFLVDFQTP